jgi:methionine synthase II (cobalamin-independent)
LASSTELEKLANILDLSGYAKELITLGVIDSHTTKIEDARKTTKALLPVFQKARRIGVPSFYVSNSSDLEFLPYRFAVKKIRKLGVIGRRLSAYG